MDSSSSQSSGSDSDHSVNSLFTIRSSPEPDGVVEDQNDKIPVSQPENERLKRVPIKEMMPDGSKNDVGEMDLQGCRGYYSFASKLREIYAGDDLTEAEENDNLVHVLWPWHHYRTRYMDEDHHELDPRRLAWSKFSGKLGEIRVEKELAGSSGYSVVENHQHIACQNADMFRIIFREAVNVTRPDIVRDIDRSKFDSFRSFIWIIHTFWAAWRVKEPLDPERVTDFNMVLEQSNSLHPLYSVKFFDENNELIEIPPHLSLAHHELSTLEPESSGEEELADDESGDDENDDESGAEDIDLDDGNAEVIDKNDENNEQEADGMVNLKKKVNERDEEVVNDADVQDSDEEDSQTTKNFLQRVANVVILRQGRVL